jgi:LysR family transcriptional regulator, low CO2-responsive transcriptional regulator
LDVTNKSRVIEALEQNEVDMVLVSIIPEHIKVEKLELLPNQIYLVGQPGLKFKNQKHTSCS